MACAFLHNKLNIVPHRVHLARRRQLDAKSKQPRPCDKGSWSPGGSPKDPSGSCIKCAPGLTTQTDESTKARDCEGACSNWPKANTRISLTKCAVHSLWLHCGCTASHLMFMCAYCSAVCLEGRGGPSCALCPPGSFSAGGGKRTPCSACEAGQTSPRGATNPAQCFAAMMPVSGIAGSSMYA
jgi:hypothetical protein